MSQPAPVEIINFGDELLVGIRENEHLKYLGEQLSRFGLPVTRNRVITDDAEEIKRSFLNAWEQSSLVITTGGLGPTADDRTRESVAEALGEELVFDASIQERIERYFAILGRPMGARQHKQCYRFENGEVFQNEVGTAPGLLYRAGGKILVMLPGPSHELRPMFRNSVLPLLQQEGLLSEEEAYVQLRTFGAGESSIEQIVQPIVDHYPELTVAFCAHYGMVDVRLSCHDGSFGWERLKEVAQEARELIGEDFVCFGHCSLAEVVFYELRSLNRTIAVAESCTGGLLGDAFTNVPGASHAFKGGIVCYMDDAKIALLDVPESILEQHGAVSPECSIAMASGAAERLSADYGLSITGYAGPEGGTEENPVGTIQMGYHSPVGVWSKTVRYTGGRLSVKARAVNAALDWMRRKLRQHKIEEILSCGESD